MIFLIEYIRKEGRTVSCREFESSDRQAAEDARFKLEMEHYRNGVELEREAVLLEADDEECIRRTHMRYFYSLDEILACLKAKFGAGGESTWIG